MGAYPQIQTLGPPGSIAAGKARYEWNRFQAPLLRACFLPDVSLVIATTGVRTGKTGTQASFHRFQAKRNPGVRGIWLVESYKWFKRSALPVCRQLFGHEANWHGTDHTWTWPAFGNSQVVICTNVDLQSMQGITAGWGSIDEYQNMGMDAHSELEQRISDSRARHPCILITGLPDHGSWADSLAEDAGGLTYEEVAVENDRRKEAGEDPLTCVHFTEIATDVNIDNIHGKYLARMAERLSPDEYQRRLKGLKPMPKGAVFKNWLPLPYDPQADSEGGNLIDWEYDKRHTTSLYFDPGARRAACIAAQHDNKRDLDVLFDEHNYDDTNTRATCIALRELYVPRALQRQEPFKRPLDEIVCDPAGNNSSTAENITDIRVLRECFPGVNVRYTYNRRVRHIPTGINIVNARILSASGKRRLLMSIELWDRGLKDRRRGDGYTKAKRGRSMAFTIVRLKYAEDKDGRALSNEPVKCPVDSHCGDALRYGMINRYGLPSGGQFQAT